MLRLGTTVLLSTLVLSAPASAARPLRGFVGMDVGGPLFDPRVNVAGEFDLMVSSGVERVRAVFNWAGAQPYANDAQVPPSVRSQFQDVGGVPTDLSAIDRVVGLSVARGMKVLPAVMFTPAWAAEHPGDRFSPPANPSTYASFLTALIGRYGPHGSFWRANPGLKALPIGSWQIWNEPDLRGYWPHRPWAPSYVALLRAANAAIKRADPGAKVVLGGLTNYSWRDLKLIYKVRGSRKLFDVVALHPYTKVARGVIEILRRDRTVMARHGDARKPIVVTETSFPSSAGKVRSSGFDTTEAGQPPKIRTLLSQLAANASQLRLIGFYYYTWIDDEVPYDWTHFTGLRRLSGNQIASKPALSAFRKVALKIEGCRSKGSASFICR